MIKLLRRWWRYLTAKAESDFNERADPKIQLEQAIGEAQDQQRRLKEQAANVIAHQKQTELRLNRAMGELEKVNANARQAVANTPEKRITIRVREDSARRVARFEVSDTGVGIAPESLSKIFQHGFTTKATGHGFGLHSSANAASEMGGKLSVESAGLGRGATFILEIPCRQQQQEIRT